MNGRATFAGGLWRLADPKISLASIASMGLGAAIAAAEGPLAWGWLVVVVLGILALETAKNALGEVVDFDSGADLGVAAEDRSPFSGGKRVLVDGTLSRRQAVAIAVVGFAACIAIGLAIAWLKDWRVVWFGLAGVGCAYGYHGSPLRLSYRGFGELVVGLCYGPLVCTGTYFVQRGRVTSEVLGASVPFAMLVVAFLWVNEFPDYRADRQAGKRNLVVRLGRERARWGYLFLVAAALAVTAALPWLGGGRGAWLGLVAAVPALRSARIVWRHPTETARIIPAQGLALMAFVLHALGVGSSAVLLR